MSARPINASEYVKAAGQGERVLAKPLLPETSTLTFANALLDVRETSTLTLFM
jgi:hypothetical protein